MSDLSEFLLARIAEDEAAARTMIDNEAWVSDCNEPHNARIEMWDQTATIRTWLLDGHRVLAECRAKAAAIGAYRGAVNSRDALLDSGADAPLITLAGTAVAALELALTALALPYASHPDYDEAWRP